MSIHVIYLVQNFEAFEGILFALTQVLVTVFVVKFGDIFALISYIAV